MDRRCILLCTWASFLTALAAADVDLTGPFVFRSNDTLLGVHVPCSDAEKACFRYNRLLDPETGKCHRVGSRGPCFDSVFLLDRIEFQSTGKLVGICQDPGTCANHRFRMAFDGKCYTSKEVFGTFCDVKKGLLGWPYFFGGYECVCESASCPNTLDIQQPVDGGKCLFPNFRKDLTSNFLPHLPANDMECSTAHSECFRRGLLSFGSNERCYSLFSRDPCPQDHRLVLDKPEAEVGKISAVCQPVKRCPKGKRFMAHIERCVNQTEINNVLCPDMNTFTDVFGETVCRFKEEFFDVQLISRSNGKCALRYNVALRRMPELPKLKCVSSNPLDCMNIDEMHSYLFDDFYMKK